MTLLRSYISAVDIMAPLSKLTPFLEIMLRDHCQRPPQVIEQDVRFGSEADPP